MIGEVIIAVIGALLSLGIFYLGKYKERKANEREIKERKYVGFLESLIGWKTTETGGDEVGRSLQSIYLVGDKDVVRKTSELITYLEGAEAKSKARQDELYTAMVYAMKRDLYQMGNMDEYPEKIGLTTFGN